MPVGKLTLPAATPSATSSIPMVLVDPDGPRRQRFGVELDPHGVLGGAVHVDLRDARDRGQALRDEGLGVFV